MTWPPTGQRDFTSWLGASLPNPSPRPVKITPFTFRQAITNWMMATYTRVKLEAIFIEILALPFAGEEDPREAVDKRSFIEQYTGPMNVAEMAHLAMRIINEVDDAPPLQAMLDAYSAGGGVTGTPKNLIFAANGPKPEIVFTDAIDNNIAISRHSEHCLVYDRPITGAGLTYGDLVTWWRSVHPEAGDDDVAAGRNLHARLVASLASHPERLLFQTYAARYAAGFDIPALVPQVYLHYDPYTARQRGPAGSPLPRQRMDFLILFSDRRRVVIEVDGAQHYSENGQVSPRLYSEMVAADRDLRLIGYEVYRFGGSELGQPDATELLNRFFDRLAARPD